jgi:hypothetical protein
MKSKRYAEAAEFRQFSKQYPKDKRGDPDGCAEGDHDKSSCMPGRFRRDEVELDSCNCRKMLIWVWVFGYLFFFVRWIHGQGLSFWKLRASPELPVSALPDWKMRIGIACVLSAAEGSMA